jgi:hypothetical protein
MKVLALPSLPATAATGSGIAARVTLHDTTTALLIAGLAGLLALIAVFAVSPECQKTLRLWIRHRAEHRIAGAKSFEIRRRARAATCGRRWTKDGAKEIREATVSSGSAAVDLSDVMRITRLYQRGTAEWRSQDGCVPASDASDNGSTHGSLEVLQGRAPKPEQDSVKSALG